MKELFIGGGIGVLIIWLILLATERIHNAKRKRETKRKANDEDQITFELPCVGYDSSGYHLPTELEMQVQTDEAQISENLQKKHDAKRKRRGKKANCGVRH
jgi:hypothetical protein